MLHARMLVLVAFVVTACSGEGGTPNNVATTGSSSVLAAAAVPSEKLDAQYVNGKVIARVISNGCTRADQFSISHQINKNSCVLNVNRDAPDLCKRASFVSQIEIDWPMLEECQSREIDFANPSLSAD